MKQRMKERIERKKKKKGREGGRKERKRKEGKKEKGRSLECLPSINMEILQGCMVSTSSCFVCLQKQSLTTGRPLCRK